MMQGNPDIDFQEATSGRSPIERYVRRMRGMPGASVHPKPSPLTVLTAFLGCFVGIYLIALPEVVNLPISTKFFLIGSFGASAALLFGAPRAPLAQPRSLIFGQLIAAVCGVSAFKLVGGDLGLAAGLAVGSATAIMLLTGSLHPPAGATALIAVLGPAKVHALGYEYVLSPVLIGVLILLVTALLINNLSPDENRHYPLSWW
jgi:CBS domain-containing membrane protein